MRTFTKDESELINDFIENNPHLSYTDGVAQIKSELKLSLNQESYRKRYRRLGMAPKKVTKQTKNAPWASVVTSFVKFLSRTRTRKELNKRFGKQVAKLLKTDFGELKLFTQVNDRNENVFMLLPQISERVEVTPKDWTYHIGHNDDKTIQPYIMCQLPAFKEKLDIALLFDVHYGHAQHRHKKLLSYIKWIKDNPNVYAILGGDIMENALDDGRGMSYDQIKNPDTQLNDMIRLLSPIAHKILVATPGNHEERTYKKTGLDPMKFMAQQLDIPYFNGPIYMSVLANGYKWKFHIFHGRGNSQTKGGKMNSAGRPRKFLDFVHFIISGHVHDRVCDCETTIVEDPANARLIYPQQWTVVAPSFLGWEDTYAYRAGYAPPAKGGVAVELFENGDYKASLT